MPNFRRGPLRPQEFFLPQYPFGFPQLVAVAPASSSLVLTAFAPIVSTPVLLTPGVRALTLVTFAPSVSTPRLVTPAKASLLLIGFAPSILISSPLVIKPGVSRLILTSQAPIVQGDLHIGGLGHVLSDSERRLRFPLTPEPQPVLVLPPTGRLRLTAFAPLVSVAEGAIDMTEAYIALYASGALSDEEFSGLIAA